jgi:Pro-kumamolisin, activation domain
MRRCIVAAALGRVFITLLIPAFVTFSALGSAVAAESEVPSSVERPKYPVPSPIPSPPPVPSPQPIPHPHKTDYEGCARPVTPCLPDCGERHSEYHRGQRCPAEAEARCGEGCATRPVCDPDRDARRCPSKEEEGNAASLPPDGRLKLSTFALYSERSLRLGESDTVDGGDIGVRSVSGAAGGWQLRIGDRAHIDRARIAAAPSVSIGDDVAVGLVATDRFRDDGVRLGPLASFPAAGMPPLPLVFGGGAGADVAVGRDQALALQPGSYGALSVDGVLLLNPGRYAVTKVRIGDGGRIVAITGNVEMDIADTLTVGRQAAIYPDFDLPARQLKIAVSGYDSDGNPAASFGEGSRVRALLAAPHGALTLADHARATGAFAAFDIAAGEDVRVKFEDGFLDDAANQHGSQQLSGYFTAPIRGAPVVGPVPRAQVISLAIGLPAPDPNALRKAVQDAADPANPAFRKYLTPSQFAAAHGAAPADYQGVIDWAKTHGLTVVVTYPNRLLVDVSGTAEQIEQALFVELTQRLRPDGSLFYAIDRDPSINLGAKLLWISGLENRVIAKPGAGSGGAGPPSGAFNSKDLRAAYAACTALTGAGQTVGLFELDGFTAGDITAYECQLGGTVCNAGVPAAAVPNVATTLLDKATGAATTVAGSFEAALDIEMAVGVAPGLAAVRVFEAPNTGNAAFHNDILASMATTLPLINQLSSSWFFSTDANTQQALYELALQGQTFLQAAGDEGSSSWGTDPGDIRDLDAVTVVGGTTLTLTGTPPVYGSETPWNAAGEGAGGGGIAANVAIPAYQSGVDMSKNGGSTTNRNLPDVAAVASNLGSVTTNPTTGVQTTGYAIGSSAAAPIWAGLIAIANQQSASSATGAGRVGNANAFLYSIGKNATAYAASFNDIASGNNSGSCPGLTGTSSAVCLVPVTNPLTGVTTNQQVWTPGAGSFSAVKGYDLATGWGSPKCALLNELATGATTATASSPVTITYHQTGACNGFSTSTGITSAGVNQAYVLFGIEKIDNSGGAAAFAYDPTKLYVQQSIRNFIDPGLEIYPNIIGPFASVAMTVAKGATLPFSPVGQGALVVQTVDANGSKEANQTPYFLRYNAGATDPTVLLAKSDFSRTSWPNTEDCKTITLK